jgi:transcriptional regulator GlxA family with amidase domain
VQGVKEVRSSIPAIESVGFLLIPGFALLSYAAAIEPLRAANQLAGKTLYRWWHAAPGDKPAIASNGAAVLPDFKFGSDTGPLDLMLVCAGGNPATFKDRRTFTWLRKLAGRGVIVGGVSGGPFILARAGLLHRRRCTVHWEHIPALQEAFPDIALTRSLFELDGDRITCSGGVAGLDMMVALITRDHGYELGAAVSDWFLHTHVREGTGPQRMDLRFRFGVADDRLLKVLKAMEAHLETPLSRRRLANLAGMSLRQMERSFRNHIGRGVHEHYLALRLGRSRQLLRETSLSILEVALAAGFASASQFSKAFRRAFGCPPREAVRREKNVRHHGGSRD